MVLPGGAADKFGNLYEGRWTVGYLLDIMDEKYHSIRLEEPGPLGKGFEFWVKKEEVVEYHQVKSSGPWTIRQLGKEGVLLNFTRNLRDPEVRCVFISADNARQLADLTQKARNSASWEEFSQEPFFTKEIEGSFRQYLKQVPELSELEAYEQLGRIRVDNVSENILRNTVRDRAFVLVDDDPGNVVAVLGDFAMEAGSQHRELTGLDIWKHLNEGGFSRRSWDKDPHVLSMVEEVNRRYVDSLRNQAIRGNVLLREEVETIGDLLRSEDGKIGILVTGEAGVGKSGVMFQVVENLLEAGMPVISFKADWLEPTHLPDDVGKQIGLARSPARVLAAVAQGRHCVLVIDQMDAISLASGRNTSLFECIHEILAQAQTFPNIGILLACRKFDLDNDVRLRQLTVPGGIAEPMPVSRLSGETVRSVVSELGINADLLGDRQLELLSVPLHLKLLSDLPLDEDVRALNFESAQDLYAMFWKHKRQVLGQRLGRTVEWSKVINSLCGYMHEHQTLSAPEAIVDEWEADASAMSSENVLILDKNRFSFFHEGFFDYSYARDFAARNVSLLELLIQDEQGLFRRTQVRQILLYLRGVESPRYLRDLGAVLHSGDVRFHIKQVIFGLLADLSKPTKEEWDILSSFDLEDRDNPSSRQVWALLRRSAAWFQLVDSLALVQQWLEATKEDLVDQTTWILPGVQQHLPDRTAELLSPFIGKSERWNDRLLWLAQLTDWSNGRPYFELMLRLIDEGVLDRAVGPVAVNDDFWSLVGGWGRRHPAWACEVIGHYLSRRRELSIQAGQPNPFHRSEGTIPFSNISRELFSASARGAPKAFATEVLPFLCAVIEDVEKTKSEGLEVDSVWSRRILPGGYSAASIMLDGMATAFSQLAVYEPDEFLALIEQIKQSQSETIQYLLIHGFSSNAARFADEGLYHLCELPARLNVGHLSDRRWTVLKLIEAATPHASPEALENLENMLLGFYPDWEMSEGGSDYLGLAQYGLLDGISEGLRSDAVVSRLEELGQNFPEERPSAPSIRVAQRVRSPISEAAAATMTDDQWLSEMSKYGDGITHTSRDGEIFGGAGELSRVLEQEVKRDAERFSDLITSFPDDISPSYFAGVLQALRDADLDIDIVARVCERCDQIPGKPVGREISDLIAALGQGDLPPTLMDLVAWYATEHPDPEEELWRIPVPVTGEFHYQGDIFAHGINTVRGRAVGTAAQLLRDKPDRLGYLQPALEKMVRDPSIAVRSCVAEVLTVSLSIDDEMAVRLFIELCKIEDDLLLTPYAERFLHSALLDHFDTLSDVLGRMIHSSIPEVSTAGGRLACLISLDLPEAAPFVEGCLSGSEFQRLGVAEVLAANVRSAAYRSFCEESLAQLFDDPSADVRAAASRWFDRIEGSELGSYSPLVAQFVGSNAFAGNEFQVLRALEETTADLFDVSLSACERFVDVAGSAASDIRTSYAGQANRVVQLTLRAYRQSSDDAGRARSLDVVDRLMENGAFGIEQALENYER